MPTERLSPEQRHFARALRHQLTDCERLLWRQLRNRGLADFKFRRQHPWPPYVLDFYCAELGLVVELDGGQHYDDAGRERDRIRTLFLHRQGLEVLRFSNLDVLQNLDGVLTELLRWADAHPSPQPSPQRGEGAGLSMPDDGGLYVTKWPPPGSATQVPAYFEGGLTELLRWADARPLTPTLSPEGRGSWIERAG